eukprot:TRINITY_DN1764_c0_g1_i2.p1 TRINITY_DN1764_c0_g1~~TRINITY_DN1764_c0_g1_i2.p1  ORF type:complete len:200 (-),score=43.03 TRINITY_DN1764_c0_g1_i2:298-897(-)
MSDPSPHRPPTPTRSSHRPTPSHTPLAPSAPKSAPTNRPTAARPSQPPQQSDPTRSSNIIKGFTMNKMTLRDAESGKLFWESSSDWKDVLTSEQIAHVPKVILKSRAVSREINFSSAELIANFKLVQIVYLHNTPIEEWDFAFGFVIPGSTNTWQSTIEAAPESQMLPAEVLSGNVIIETLFYDGDFLIAKSKVRVYYI